MCMNYGSTCMSDESNQQVKNQPHKPHIQSSAKITKNKVVKQSIYASPLGSLLIQHNGRSIQHIKYLNLSNTQENSLAFSSLPQRWLHDLNSYFCGDFEALNHLPVRLDQGTEFQQQVWLALRKIKAGQTWSYTELANRIKRPNAVRAVGQALKRNPIVIVLPCHRIIQQSGALGGYEGDMLSGSGRKQFLLWHEGAVIPVAKHKTDTDVF